MKILLEFGNKELEILLEFYGINSENIHIEWFNFKMLIYKNYQNILIDRLLILLFQLLS